MKTAEQIARETSRNLKDFPYEPSEYDLRQAMIAAIEADRAQRENPLCKLRETVGRLIEKRPSALDWGPDEFDLLRAAQAVLA